MPMWLFVQAGVTAALQGNGGGIQHDSVLSLGPRHVQDSQLDSCNARLVARYSLGLIYVWLCCHHKLQSLSWSVWP